MIDTIWDEDEIIINTSIWDNEHILDTSIYDGKGNETSLYVIWTYKSFEEYKFYTSFGNQKIEFCDFGNH